MWSKTKLFFLLFLLSIITYSGCGGVGSEPIALPVPFSGSLTDNGILGISEGNPVGLRSVASQNLSIKAQSQTDPLTWLVFDANTGVERGTVTFFPETIEIEQTFDVITGGKRRIFTMRASSELDGIESTSSNFKCFDYPTVYPATFSAEACNGNPEGIPVVRKMTCSGNDDVTGLLLDGKFITGMIQDPNRIDSPDEFQFCTQQESFVFNRNVPFTPASGEPEGNILFTMLIDGVAQPVPGTMNAVTSNIFIPGNDEVQGVVTATFIEGGPVVPGSEEVVSSVSNAEFILEDSRLVSRNCRTFIHRIPELDEVIQELVSNKFPDAPQAIKEEGQVFFNSIDTGECEPVNCDPAAGEATGIFQDLCQEFGGLRSTFLCFILADPNGTIQDFVFITSVWKIIRGS